MPAYRVRLVEEGRCHSRRQVVVDWMLASAGTEVTDI